MSDICTIRGLSAGLPFAANIFLQPLHQKRSPQDHIQFPSAYQRLHPVRAALRHMLCCPRQCQVFCVKHFLFFFLTCKLGSLIGCCKCVDYFIKCAVKHLFKSVDSKTDSVVGNSSLRIVVSSYSFGTVACSHL